jgi:phasin family protein
MAYNQKSIEASIATAKALMGCKTMQDLVEVQSDLTRKGLDEWVSEGTKLSELTVKVANEAAAPINSRLTEAVDRFMKPLAA